MDYNYNGKTKARYWTGVCYPENMVEGWEVEIGDILQYPYSYCIHNKCHLAEYKPSRSTKKAEKERHRKIHVHIIVAYPNTTTYANALNLFKKLSKDGCSCINTVEPVENIRHMYDYLIHDTKTAKSQKKYQYSPEERICGNNFDIGAYEQLSIADKVKMKIELSDYVIQNCFTNYATLWMDVSSNFSEQYLEIIMSNSSHFERLCKGNFFDGQHKNSTTE